MFGVEGGLCPCVQCLQFWCHTTLLVWLHRTFAAKLNFIVTLKLDTEEGRQAAFKRAEKILILVIVVETIVMYVSVTAYLCVQAQTFFTMYSIIVHKI